VDAAAQLEYAAALGERRVIWARLQVRWHREPAEAKQEPETETRSEARAYWSRELAEAEKDLPGLRSRVEAARKRATRPEGKRPPGDG
jgi:hypothetical protein